MLDKIAITGDERAFNPKAREDGFPGPELFTPMGLALAYLGSGGYTGTGASPGTDNARALGDVVCEATSTCRQRLSPNREWFQVQPHHLNLLAALPGVPVKQWLRVPRLTLADVVGPREAAELADSLGNRTAAMLYAQYMEINRYGLLCFASQHQCWVMDPSANTCNRTHN